jgi:hypothetical protein
MADSMQEALAKLLDEYDARRLGDVERERRAKDEAAQFLTQFAELRRDVIRPVFEAAGAMLEARGHRFSITEQEFVGGAEGRIGEAGISLRIAAAGTKAPLHEDQRSLAITTRHYNRTVWINSGEAPNAGGIAGAKGAYTLDKVTRELIEHEVVGFVARVVAG